MGRQIWRLLASLISRNYSTLPQKFASIQEKGHYNCSEQTISWFELILQPGEGLELGSDENSNDGYAAKPTLFIFCVAEVEPKKFQIWVGLNLFQLGCEPSAKEW